MYNGIGLQTPRGSGTSGYVQANKFKVKHRPVAVQTREFEEGQGLGGVSKRANKDILEHDRKRQIELKLLELRDLLEDQGYPEEEILAQQEEARAELEKEAATAQIQPESIDMNKASSHQIVALKERRMEALKGALGISGEAREGEAFDRELQDQRKQERIAVREQAEREREERAQEEAAAARRREKERKREERKARKEEKRERRGKKAKERKGRHSDEEEDEEEEEVEKEEEDEEEKADEPKQKPGPVHRDKRGRELMQGDETDHAAGGGTHQRKGLYGVEKGEEGAHRERHREDERGVRGGPPFGAAGGDGDSSPLLGEGEQARHGSRQGMGSRTFRSEEMRGEGGGGRPREYVHGGDGMRVGAGQVRRERGWGGSAGEGEGEQLKMLREEEQVHDRRSLSKGEEPRGGPRERDRADVHGGKRVRREGRGERESPRGDDSWIGGKVHRGEYEDEDEKGTGGRFRERAEKVGKNRVAVGDDYEVRERVPSGARGHGRSGGSPGRGEGDWVMGIGVEGKRRRHDEDDEPCGRWIEAGVGAEGRHGRRSGEREGRLEPRTGGQGERRVGKERRRGGDGSGSEEDEWRRASGGGEGRHRSFRA